MRFKTIIFDLDGTLVDSEDLHFRVWQKILSSYGVQANIQDLRRDHQGVPALENATLMIEKFKIKANPEQLAQTKFNLTVKKLAAGQAPPLPGVIELLNHLQGQKIPLGVVTGGVQRAAQASLKSAGLLKYFQFIITKDHVENNKPDPSGYQLCLQKLNASPEESLAVEDTPTGVTAAKAAGLTCFAVQPNKSFHPRLRKEADKIFLNIGEIKEHI